MRKDVDDKNTPIANPPEPGHSDRQTADLQLPNGDGGVLDPLTRSLTPLGPLRLDGESWLQMATRVAGIVREWALISPLLHDAAKPGEDGPATAHRLLADPETRKVRQELLLAQRPCDGGSVANTAERLRAYDAVTFTAVTLLAQHALVDLNGRGAAGSLIAAVKRLTSRSAGIVAADAVAALKTVNEVERVLGRWRERGAAVQPSTVELAGTLSNEIESWRSVGVIIERAQEDGESIIATVRRLAAVAIEGDPAEELAEVRDILTDHLGCEETVAHCVGRLVTTLAGNKDARDELVQVLPDGRVAPVFPPAQVTAADVAVLADVVGQLADFAAGMTEGYAGRRWHQWSQTVMKIAERLLARPPAPADDPHRKRDMFPPRCGAPTCGRVIGHDGDCDNSFPAGHKPPECVNPSDPKCACLACLDAAKIDEQEA